MLAFLLLLSSWWPLGPLDAMVVEQRVRDRLRPPSAAYAISVASDLWIEMQLPGYSNILCKDGEDVTNRLEALLGRNDAVLLRGNCVSRQTLVVPKGAKIIGARDINVRFYERTP